MKLDGLDRLGEEVGHVEVGADGDDDHHLGGRQLKQKGAAAQDVGDLLGRRRVLRDERGGAVVAVELGQRLEDLQELGEDV